MDPVAARRAAFVASPPIRAVSWPLLAWALVLVVTMLSFYVHLLNEQVQRGERLRATQRLSALPAPAYKLRAAANDLRGSDLRLQPVRIAAR